MSLQLFCAFHNSKYFLFFTLFIVYWLIAWLTGSVWLIDSFQSSLSFRIIKWIDFICKYTCCDIVIQFVDKVSISSHLSLLSVASTETVQVSHRETVSLNSSWHCYLRHQLCLHWGRNWSVSERVAHHASQWRSAGILEKTPWVISDAGATRRGSLSCASITGIRWTGFQCLWVADSRALQPPHQEPGETGFCENEPRTVVREMSVD